MLIKIITIGSPSSKSIESIIQNYIKGIKTFGKIEWLNFHMKTKNTNIKVKKETEAKKIIPHLSSRAHIFALDEKGEKYNSNELASLINKTMHYQSEFIFIIGGADGLCNSILEKSNTILSLSAMTFPHQIVKILLIEQIYRAFSIINNLPYHRE